jgi:hypothetical protein
MGCCCCCKDLTTAAAQHAQFHAQKTALIIQTNNCMVLDVNAGGSELLQGHTGAEEAPLVASQQHHSRLLFTAA